MNANETFRLTQDAASTDDKGNIHLGQAAKAKRYRVLTNDAGQILLDPIENLPEQEQWLWQNPTALVSVQRGIEQAAAGETRSLGSFAQYADLEDED
jgi:hypothetical protein